MLRACTAMLLCLLLAACVTGPRSIGEITFAEPAIAASEQVMVVTTRQPSPDKNQLFGAERSDSLHFAEMIVSVPLKRTPGSISPPNDKPDLARDFGVTSATLTDDEAAFASRLRAELATHPVGQRSGHIRFHFIIDLKLFLNGRCIAIFIYHFIDNGLMGVTNQAVRCLKMREVERCNQRFENVFPHRLARATMCQCVVANHEGSR